MKGYQVIHGQERGETAALLLSPQKPTIQGSTSERSQYGSQFTFFLTAPLQALCQVVGVSSEDMDPVS